MSDLNINNITDRTGDSGPVIAGVSTVTSTGAFTVPVGPTEMRGGRGRGVIGGGNNPAITSLEYVTIATTGNATDFGDLISAGWGPGSGVASPTRGIFAGGYVNSPSATFFSTIQYVTISSQGGASDFGDLIDGSYRPPGLSDSTRGVFGGGFTDNPADWTKIRQMQYVTIASTGNASDFGDLTPPKLVNASGCGSPIRGLFGGGMVHPLWTNIIDYITIQTKGDAKEFGDLTVKREEPAALSSTTRAVWGGGSTPGDEDTMDYVTIASLGNATDFGNLVRVKRALSATSNAVRGIFTGGNDAPVTYDDIDYITIASTGNATDFGNLITARRDSAACSDSHGGLG